MMALTTADLHLTAEPKDRYRWRIFTYLESQCVKHGPDVILILGDLTDHKDEHPSPLVNFIVAWIRGLAKHCQVIILRGNHDYIDENQPFFQFLGEGDDNIAYIVKPTERTIAGASCLFLPNTRHYEEDWKGFDFSRYDYIFCHQSFDGCIAENGTKLGGIPPSIFGSTKAKVYSGDIHKPQRLDKRIEYVGAPYHIRFGDSFLPRMLLIGQTDFREKHTHAQKDLHPDFMMKHVIDLNVEADYVLKSLRAGLEDKESERVDIMKGDQVKVRVHLDRAEIPQWPKLKQQITKVVGEHGLVLLGLELHAQPAKAKEMERSQGKAKGRQSPIEALEAHAKRQGLSVATIKAGKALLKEAEGG